MREKTPRNLHSLLALQRASQQVIGFTTNQVSKIALVGALNEFGGKPSLKFEKRCARNAKQDLKEFASSLGLIACNATLLRQRKICGPIISSPPVALKGFEAKVDFRPVANYELLEDKAVKSVIAATCPEEYFPLNNPNEEAIVYLNKEKSSKFLDSLLPWIPQTLFGVKLSETELGERGQKPTTTGHCDASGLENADHYTADIAEILTYLYKLAGKIPFEFNDPRERAQAFVRYKQICTNAKVVFANLVQVGNPLMLDYENGNDTPLRDFPNTSDFRVGLSFSIDGQDFVGYTARQLPVHGPEHHENPRRVQFNFSKLVNYHLAVSERRGRPLGIMVF